jgi:hypothetical protein
VAISQRERDIRVMYCWAMLHFRIATKMADFAGYYTGDL